MRHAVALTELKNLQEAEAQYQAALILDERQARGWWKLIRFGKAVAGDAARLDSRIAMPGDLFPEACIFAVLTDEDRRPPSQVASYK